MNEGRRQPLALSHYPLPEAVILPEASVVPGIDGQKMSKSYNNAIELFAPRVRSGDR